MFGSKLLLTLVAMLTLSLPAYCELFTSQYCEFQLPPGWSCALEGAEWVCQSTNKDRQREAIIILAAKKRGTQDSLEEYESYLKNQKTFTIPGGKTQVSEPKYTKMTEVNSHKWVDSLHMASEVPGFFTRYLATVKEDLGVAVTFSVAKDYYQQYKDMFDNVISTLKVFRDTNTPASNLQLKQRGENLLDSSSSIPDIDEKIDVSQRERAKGGAAKKSAGYLLLLLVLAGVGGFFFMKNRGKKK